MNTTTVGILKQKITETTLFDTNILTFFRSLLRNAKGRGNGAVRFRYLPRNLSVLMGVLRFQRRQMMRRKQAAVEGKIIPPIIIASVTRRCNLNCTGCYSKELRSDSSSELSDNRFMEIFSEGLDMGVSVLMLAGGEPLLRKSLLQRVASLKGPLVPVFTNGLLLDNEYCDLFSSSRLVPVFSIEGDAVLTAERRGLGVHEGIVEKTRELNGRGCFFGFSITLSSNNFDMVMSSRFLSKIEKTGASVLFLVEYVPVTPGTETLVLTDSQQKTLMEPGYFDSYRFEVVSLPGDEEQYGGCLAAGRGFIHVADDGKLEACPFAPFSDTGVAERSLAEALDSPLMKAIRENHNELTETKGGCALWNKRGWVASLGKCSINK